MLLELRFSTVATCERNSPESSLLDLAGQLTLTSPVSQMLIAAQAEYLIDPTIGYQALSAMKCPRATPLLLLCEPGQVLATAFLASTLSLEDPDSPAELLLIALEASTNESRTHTMFTSFALKVCEIPLIQSISPSKNGNKVDTVADIYRLIQYLNVQEAVLRITRQNSSMSIGKTKEQGHFSVHLL